MHTQRVVIALTAFNMLVLLVGLSRNSAADAKSDATIIRALAFELVDADGDIRSRLNVEEDGEVVLRMTDETGTIRMKLGAGVDGSGLVLLDDETEPGVHLLAEPTGPSVTLTGKDGQELVLAP
ncbi:MAG: hypothetical protein ACRDJC_06505 [Thermomicrobiales bacterium]